MENKEAFDEATDIVQILGLGRRMPRSNSGVRAILIFAKHASEREPSLLLTVEIILFFLDYSINNLSISTQYLASFAIDRHISRRARQEDMSSNKNGGISHFPI